MLGNRFYHEIIKKTVIAFGTLFNNIEIKHKADDTDQTLSIIKVPIAYGPIQKFLARVEQQPNFDRTVAITLPRLAFEIISYRYDPSRKASPITKFCGVENNKIKKVFMPVPYDIGFRLSFASKLQDDALQILEQILPFFQPSFSVSVKLIAQPIPVPSQTDPNISSPVSSGNLIYPANYENDIISSSNIVNTGNCNIFSSDYVNKYSKFQTYIPTINTPVKTIKIALHFFQQFFELLSSYSVDAP